MKTDTERKLDELLAQMPKRDYDLDAWLNEDETAEFDRLQRTNTDLYLQRTNTDLYSQQTNTDLHGSKRKAWRWVAAAACLLIIIGIGVTTELMHQKPEDMPAIAENHSQPLPSLQVEPETSKPLPLEEEIQPQPPTLEGRKAARPKKKGLASEAIAQNSRQDATADTLGSGIWQREENVVLALQMLSECEQTIRREEQEVRNTVIEATFNAVPRPANVILVSDENGAYEVVETKRIINI